MWFKFDKIEFKSGLVSKNTGKSYDAYIVSGWKRGFDGEPDEEYTKTFFDNSTTTIIEQGIRRPDKSVVQFFQKACRQGDTVVFKNVRNGKTWNLESLENISNGRRNPGADYEPLTDEEISSIKKAQELTAVASSTDTMPAWVK